MAGITLVDLEGLKGSPPHAQRHLAHGMHRTGEEEA